MEGFNNSKTLAMIHTYGVAKVPSEKHGCKFAASYIAAAEVFNRDAWTIPTNTAAGSRKDTCSDSNATSPKAQAKTKKKECT